MTKAPSLIRGSYSFQVIMTKIGNPERACRTGEMKPWNVTGSSTGTNLRLHRLLVKSKYKYLPIPLSKESSSHLSPSLSYI